MRTIQACALLALFCGAVSAEEGDAAIRDKTETERATLLASLRIPTREVILKAGPSESVAIGNWVQQTIEEKEKRAQQEMAAMKKKFQEEEDARIKAETERAKRAARFEGTQVREIKRQPLRLRLAFQVMEIDTFKRAIETCRVQKQLADDVQDVLTRLDVDRDGRLAADEYRDACAILAGSSRLFLKIDSNEDNWLTVAEIEAARDLPKDGVAALRAGEPAADKKVTNKYDINNDGVLDVTERKALTMAFCEAALRADQDEAFYRQVSDRLSTSREIVALKFARLELEP